MDCSQEKKSTHDAKIYDYKLVRTDAKGKKLDAFVLPKSFGSENADKDIEPAPQKKRKPVLLTSILALQNDIRKNKHGGILIANLF